MSEPAFEWSTYRTIFEWLPVPVVLLDEQLRVMLANRATAGIFGLSPKQLIGISILSMIPHQKLAELLTDFGLRQSKVIEVPSTRHGNRDDMTLKITAVPLPFPVASKRVSSGGDLRLLVLEDVTQRISLERQLVDIEKAAGMGQLAAGVAHELANPLTSMASNLLFVKQAVQESDSTDVAEALDTTLERLDDMQQLISTLSNFARRPQVRQQLLDLNEVTRRSATFICKQAESRGVHIKLALASRALPCVIDRRLTNQVLLNLFKNAMEAMPKGGQLDIRTVWGAGSNGSSETALVEVTDNGFGIGEDEIKRVFRPLYSTKPRGMGLGLPFCRQVIERQGGEIRLTSKKGLGTTVTLAFPLS